MTTIQRLRFALSIFTLLFALPAAPTLAASDDIRSFEIAPIAPANPPVKDRLLFDASVRRDGNAAIAYLRALTLLRPDLEDPIDIMDDANEQAA